jgi:hypothetical protein
VQRLLALQCWEDDLILCFTVGPVNAPQKREPAVQLLQRMRAVPQHSRCCRAALCWRWRRLPRAAGLLLLLLGRRLQLCLLLRLLPLRLLMLLACCQHNHLQRSCIRLQLLQFPAQGLVKLEDVVNGAAYV